MVDLFGGSPFNAASMIALEKEDMEVITGVNMPMLLEVFASRDISSSLSELLEIAKNGGKNAIKQLEKQTGRNLDDDILWANRRTKPEWEEVLLFAFKKMLIINFMRV